MSFAWWRRKSARKSNSSPKNRQYRPYLERLEIRRVLSDAATGIIPEGVGALVNHMVSAPRPAVLHHAKVTRLATPDARNTASKTSELHQLIFAAPHAAAIRLPDLATTDANLAPRDAVPPSAPSVQAAEKAETKTAVAPLTTAPTEARPNKGSDKVKVVVRRTGHDLFSDAQSKYAREVQGEAAQPTEGNKSTWGTHPPAVEASLSQAAPSVSVSNPTPQTHLAAAAGSAHGPPSPDQNAHGGEPAKSSGEPPARSDKSSIPAGGHAPALPPSQAAPLVSLPNPTPQIHLATAAGAAHGSPDHNADGGEPAEPGGEPRARGDKSSTPAGGQAPAVPGGLSDSMLGSSFFVSASIVTGREAPGSATEMRAGGTPAGITHSALWDRFAPEPPSNHGSESASADHLWHFFESIQTGGQGMDALSSGGSSTGAGLKSLGGACSEVMAEVIWIRAPGGFAAPGASAEAEELGDGQLGGASGIGPPETASAVALGFMLTDSLTKRLGTEAERPTLLLVESDEDTRDAMTFMLFKEGFQVVAVASGRDAWNVLRSPFGPIDMMLLDVHLPDVSGLQLVQRLREIYPTLPVFAWMQASDSEDAARLAQLGVYHYALPQSAEPAELVALVRAFLRDASRPRE